MDTITTHYIGGDFVEAKRAFATYGRSSKEERAAILRRLHEAASARIDDLTAAMVEEYGRARRAV